MEFTEEELFVIEKMADQASYINHQNLLKFTEAFMVRRAMGTEDSETLNKLTASYLDECYKSMVCLKGIRDKCEARRASKDGKIR